MRYTANEQRGETVGPSQQSAQQDHTSGLQDFRTSGLQDFRTMDRAMVHSETIVLDFTEDCALTEMMRMRVSSLQRSGQKRQDGERLLLPNEAVYRLDFSSQDLSFCRWHFSLRGHGRVTITGISQHWTPDLTNLMSRQLLEPIGTFWRNSGDPLESPLKCLEADMQEFGERIAELAKVRKVMYFLLAFKEGAEAANLSCGIEFTAHK